MDFLRRAVLLAIACSWLFLSGCGTYRPIASILPLAPGNPQLNDTVAVYNVNPCVPPTPCGLPNSPTPTPSDPTYVTGTLSVFDVSGDSNVGNYQVGANDTLAAATPLTSRLITFAGGDSFIAYRNRQSCSNPACGACEFA
jgi:hypothetical protein